MLLRLLPAIVFASVALAAPAPLSLAAVKKAPGHVDASAPVQLTRTWLGNLCSAYITNRGKAPVRVREVILFDIPHSMPGDTLFYGEGSQMLSQTGGTLAAPEDIGDYTDAKHYKLPQPEGARTVYGVATFSTPDRTGHTLLGFTSGKRFFSKFHVRANSIQVVADTENLELAPGESWELEEFMAAEGMNREELLGQLATRIGKNHPRLKFDAPPTGWCSWYCFGPSVTAKQVLENLDFIADKAPGLRYVQIDDGYQPAMGDWLDTGSAFGGDVQGVLRQIRARGFQPAIWVAPFIAEAGSRLFQDHPDWFVQGPDGKPLRSDTVTFGGWRHGPWYAVDGTHPEAQKHIENVFRTMREKWGVTYFKLDANFWGTLPGGRFHDPKATRVEAYRRGMEAVLRGSGDAFILGCNHPLWPSLGLIHGSRSSNDINREWETIRHVARQGLYRNWQNGTLWWNDPDAVILNGKPTEEEFRFHATVILASGGMLLSGDDLPNLAADRLAMLRKLVPPSGAAAKFEDDTFAVGQTNLADRTLLFALNWDDQPKKMTVTLPGTCDVKELWTGQRFGRKFGHLELALPAHSGRVLVCVGARPQQ
jgi:alpha-galactosidase